MYPLSVGSISVLLLALSSVFAETDPTERCYTVFGTKSVAKVPTYTTNVNIQVTKTVIRNIHPHTTITPITHSTETITNTETDTVDASQNTDTATNTEYSTITTTTTLDTVTIHEPSTTTETTTSTYQGTSTVPTPAGFTPVLASLPNSKKRKREENTRDRSLAARSKKPAPLELFRKRYQSKVICMDFKYHTTTTRIIRTRTGTVYKTAPTSTITDTATESTTITNTNYPPDATTTITTTISDTSIITESPTTTVTDISTTTETVATATASVFAACDPATSGNFAGAANGHGFVGASGLGGSHYLGGTATSAADCCTQCFAMGSACIQGLYTTLIPTSCQLDVSDSGGPMSGSTCMTTNAGFAPYQGYVAIAGPQNAITFLCSGST